MSEQILADEMPQFEIEEKDETTTNTITAFRVVSVNVVLGIRAFVRVQLLRSDGSVIRTQVLVMEGEDYSNWTTDDYVPSFIKSQLNFNDPQP